MLVLTATELAPITYTICCGATLIESLVRNALCLRISSSKRPIECDNIV